MTAHNERFSLVLLALRGLLSITSLLLELVAVLFRRRAVLLLFLPAEAFIQLLGFLEELVEVKLSDDVLLGME